MWSQDDRHFDASKRDKPPAKHIKSESDEKKYIDLGKKKRATVSAFKGIPLLDIREYYVSEGDERPGKKGISLTLEQVSTISKKYPSVFYLTRSIVETT